MDSPDRGRDLPKGVVGWGGPQFTLHREENSRTCKQVYAQVLFLDIATDGNGRIALASTPQKRIRSISQHHSTSAPSFRCHCGRHVPGRAWPSPAGVARRGPLCEPIIDSGVASS